MTSFPCILAMATRKTEDDPQAHGPRVEAIATAGDFTVAIEHTSIQGWKVLVIGGPTPRTVSVGFETREKAESAARAYAETL